jgi:hypothetical protein
VRALGERARSAGVNRALVVRGIALAALLGAGALFFATSCEKRTLDVPTGYRGEAARDKYLAAERLLQRMGMPAKSFADASTLARLPPSSGTIVIPTPRRTLGERTSERLLGWVEAGGNLVVVTWTIWDDPNREPDPILDPLGVHQLMNDANDLAAPEDADPNAPLVGTVDFPDRDTPLEARFDPKFYFELDSEASEKLLLEIADDNGSHLVTLRHGKGLVTAVTDDYFLAQPTIGELDHAELLYRVTRLGGHRGPVWIVYGDDFPSPLGLILHHGWMVVAAALVWLALWLWSASRRFGPIAPDPTPARRELMEHVRAAGRLQWRRGGAGALLAATREALFARARSRYPAFESLTPAQQAAHLATRSGVAPARIAQALAFRSSPDPGKFAGDVAVLEKLRRSL